MTEETQAEIQQGTTSGEMQNANTQTNEAQSFTIPDAYKDRGWAKNIKSNDDAWKMLDNAQALAGKKMVVPDWEKATPQEIENYYAQLRPSDRAAYQFDESMPDDLKDTYSEILHKHGISAKQGNDLIKDFMASQNAMTAKMYDNGEFIKELKSSFGEQAPAKLKELDGIIKMNLAPADYAMIDNSDPKKPGIPNQYAAVMYRLVDNLHKAYGAKEGGQGSNNPSNMTSATTLADIDRLFKEIQAMDAKPHTVEEKQALVNKYAAAVKGVKS